MFHKHNYLLDLYLSVSNDIVCTKIYSKRDEFYFETVDSPILMVMFLFLNSSDSLEHLTMLHISLLVENFLKKAFRITNSVKKNSKFYRRYNDLITKFHAIQQALLCQGVS